MNKAERKFYLRVGAGILVGLYGLVLILGLTAALVSISSSREPSWVALLLAYAPHLIAAVCIVALTLLASSWNGKLDKLGRVSLLFLGYLTIFVVALILGLVEAP